MSYLPLLLLALLCLSCSTRVEYNADSNIPVNSAAVDINTASAADLEALPHVGRKTAEAIIEFRAANGPFRRAEELMLIRGMSERRFIEMRPFITAK